MGQRDKPQPDYDFSISSRWGVRGRMLSNTGLLGGARVLAALMGFATLIITARALSDNIAFGTLLFIHAYMLFFSEVASFQIWQALIRFGSNEVKDKNGPRFGALMRTGLVLDALAAFVAFLLAISLFSVFLWLQSLFGWDTQATATDGLSLQNMVTLYCTVILFRQINVAIGIFRLFDRFTVLAARALVMPGIRLIGAIIAERQGWGLTGFLGVWFVASLSGYLVLQVFAIKEIAARQFWPAIKRARICKSAEFPGLYSYVVKTNIDSTLNALKTNFPSLAVMVVFGPAILAIYRIAEEISRLLSRGITLFDQVLFPELSRMAVDADLKSLAATTAKSALGIGIFGFLTATVVLFFGENLITATFDESFISVPLLAVMLLVATSLIGMAMPFYTVFYVMMRPGAAIWVRVTGTASFVAIFIFLSRRFELFSIGWAAIASAIIEVILVVAVTVTFLKRKPQETHPSE